MTYYISDPRPASNGQLVTITCKTAFSVGRMKPFTLRVRSANVLPKRLPLAQRFTPSLPVSTLSGRSRRHQWACDEYMHARAHGVRTLATIAPIFSLQNDNTAMSNLTPPQAPPTWTHTPDQVTTLINELIAKDRSLWDNVGSLPKEECTFESVRPLPVSPCERSSEEQSLNGCGIWIGLR